MTDEAKKRVEENTHFIIPRLIALFSGNQILYKDKLPHLPETKNGKNEPDSIIQQVFSKSTSFFPTFSVSDCEISIHGRDLTIKRTVNISPIIYATSSVFPMSISSGIITYESLESFKSRYIQKMKRDRDEDFTLPNKIEYKLNEKVDVRESHYLQLKNLHNNSILNILDNSIRYIVAFANRDGGIIIIGVDDFETCIGFEKLDEKQKLEFEEALQNKMNTFIPPLKLNEDVFIEHHDISDELQVMEIFVNAKKDWIAIREANSYYFKNGKLEELSHHEWWDRFQEVLFFRDDSFYMKIEKENSVKKKISLSEWIFNHYEELAKIFEMEESDCLRPLLMIFIHHNDWSVEQNRAYLLQMIWRDDNWFENDKFKEMEQLKRIGHHYLSLFLALKDIEEDNQVEHNYFSQISHKLLDKRKFDFESYFLQSPFSVKLDQVFLMFVGCIVKYSKDKNILAQFLK